MACYARRWPQLALNFSIWFDELQRGEIIKQKQILQTKLFKQLFKIFLFFGGIICYTSNETLWGSIAHVTNSDIALRDHVIP
jgi:hypothetical protein